MPPGEVTRRGAYPELTWPAILVGYCLGAIIALSIGYASLKLGFSIEGSELAAILGFGVLRGVMRRHSIIENNINQSLASAVNAASAGMVFSLPALFILGYTDFNVPLTVLGCITGGILGIAFIIPLRNVDEVREYLTRARRQFELAWEKLRRLEAGAVGKLLGKDGARGRVA